MSMLLEVEDLNKSFPVRSSAIGRRSSMFHAVRGVNLSVARSETVAVVGESGSGKSTLGRMMLRLIEPDTGTIRFDGIDVRSLKKTALRKFRARAQMIFQDPYSSFDPKMTVGISVAEPLYLHQRLGRDERDERTLDLLGRVGLGAIHMARFPSELSGGQLQRAAIARAIATSPDLIVCDEPVAALDVSIRAQVLNLLSEIQAASGVSYLFVAHDLALVRLFADRVAVMYAGRVVETGEPEQLFTNPKHPYTQALLAAMPSADPGRHHLRDLALPSTQDALPLTGCPFAPRCPQVHDRCLTIEPPLVADNATTVACYLYGADATVTGTAARTPPPTGGPPQGSTPLAAPGGSRS